MSSDVDCVVVQGSRVSTDEAIKLLDLSDLAVENGGKAVFDSLSAIVASLRNNGGMLMMKSGELKDVMDRSWEKLHMGDWKDVSDCWRSAYSFCALLLGHLDSLRGNWTAAMKCFDLVLLMGTPKWHELAHFAISNAPIDAVADEEADSEPLKWNDHVPLKIPNSLEKWPLVMQYEKDALPSLEEFVERHLKPGIPCLMKGLAAEWPAVAKWRNVDYLAEIMANRTVPIELGPHYMHEEFSQQLMPFMAFLRKHVLGSSDTVGYLAQTELLKQVPNLMRDFLIPDYCAMGETKGSPTINVWLGPAGTTSPLHTDPQENIFVQICGSKVVLLHSSTENHCLYPTDGLMNNTSQVDAEMPDYNQFPEYANAAGAKVIVEAGDGLFIPKGTWHYVRGLEPSWSLSFWF